MCFCLSCFVTLFWCPNVGILAFCLPIRIVVLVYVVVNGIVFKSAPFCLFTAGWYWFKSAACIDLACYLVLYIFCSQCQRFVRPSQSTWRSFQVWRWAAFSVPPAYTMLGGKQAVPTFTSEIIIRYNNHFLKLTMRFKIILLVGESE